VPRFERVARARTAIARVARRARLLPVGRRVGGKSRRKRGVSLGAGELDPLRQAGLSEPAALEVPEVAAFFNYANRLTQA